MQIVINIDEHTYARLHEYESFIPCGNEFYNTCMKAIFDGTPLPKHSKWIPVNERLPEIDEEACSDNVLVSLRETTWDISKCQKVHITKIAYYNKYAISSDGIYMDTKGWVLTDGSTLSMDEVIAWTPLPEPYEEVKADE